MAESYFDQNLPKSEIVESGYLSAMLDHFTASYKLYWFKGIFEELKKGKLEIPYRKIVARMLASAWYPVVFYNLNLGAGDQLSKVIWYVHDILHVKRDEKEEKIVEFLCTCEDPQLIKQMKDLTHYVPFRLIRPFYERELHTEKLMNPQFSDYKIDRLIERFNQKDQNSPFYIMDRLGEKLTVSEKWAEYLTENRAIIEGWLNYRLVEYIQRRNPNVPAVSFKIFPPSEKDRNLTEETRFWQDIGKHVPLQDLYTGEPFTEETFTVYGGYSIDHFIPWSFVLHNEIWNLYPMFKNINSSKSNQLPDQERYLDAFCQKQYQAFLCAKTLPVKKKFKEQYLNVKKDIYEIGESDIGRDAFVAAMKQTIEPLYQIANNQGYNVWWYK